MKLSKNISLKTIVDSRNLVEQMSEDDVKALGEELWKDLEADIQSRSEWEKRNEEAMSLALQLKEQKSFPWVGASNVKFPLITIAALQYHARAYPGLISSETPVKCRVTTKDDDGSLTDKATRIENHMSYQILEEDEDWESEMDKTLITQPILGCAFKKSYFHPVKRHNVSEFVIPKDLVVNYWAKSIESAPRITHILYMSNNDVYERVASGLWVEMNTEKKAQEGTSGLKKVQDKTQGMSEPQPTDRSTPYIICEMHCFKDFDGDGYEEPYIITFRKDTKQVLRIVARFLSENVVMHSTKKDVVLSIKPEQFFTKYSFIPSPDGGFYDLGFGVLLGPLNGSIDTLINQLIDTGTMSNTAGGFLSRGIKLRGGNTSFAPLEWKHVETTGDDLRKGIMPLPVRDPSPVLFQLLELLINYGERIGISVDILTGQNPGQNTPAETSRTMAEQGMKIFSGIFKRTHRGFRDELRKLYRLNQLYITKDVNYVDWEHDKMILKNDYIGSTSAIRPAADPHITSDSQRIMQAEAMRQASLTVPGYNRYEVEKRYLTALKVPAIEKVYPDPNGPNAVPPTPNPKVQVEQIKAQTKLQEAQLNVKMEALKLQEEALLNQAKIQELQAKAILALEQAKGVTTGHEVALIEAQIGAAKMQQEHLNNQIKTMLQIADSMRAQEAHEKDMSQPQQTGE